MELDQLIRFAKAYTSLGTAVQQQLDDVIGGDLSDLNENAVAETWRKLNGYDDYLDASIKDALEITRS